VTQWYAPLMLDLLDAHQLLTQRGDCGVAHRRTVSPLKWSGSIRKDPQRQKERRHNAP
jgi:hypothetical protein